MGLQRALSAWPIACNIRTSSGTYALVDYPFLALFVFLFSFHPLHFNYPLEVVQYLNKKDSKAIPKAIKTMPGYFKLATYARSLAYILLPYGLQNNTPMGLQTENKCNTMTRNLQQQFKTNTSEFQYKFMFHTVRLEKKGWAAEIGRTETNFGPTQNTSRKSFVSHNKMETFTDTLNRWRRTKLWLIESRLCGTNDFNSSIPCYTLQSLANVYLHVK